MTDPKGFQVVPLIEHESSTRARCYVSSRDELRERQRRKGTLTHHLFLYNLLLGEMLCACLIDILVPRACLSFGQHEEQKKSGLGTRMIKQWSGVVLILSFVWNLLFSKLINFVTSKEI